jgi:butyryl-CoA dehydrogenase
MSDPRVERARRFGEAARRIAEEVIRPVAAKHDREATYPWEVLAALREAKLTGVWIPEEYGGAGGAVLDICHVVEEISRACGGMGVAYAVNALGSFPIILGGTEEQKRRWLPDIASGKRLISFGLSEIDSGSDAGSMKTWARREGDHYVLNGDKKWNTNGGVADIFTVYCRTAHPEKGVRGVSALVLEKGMEGFTLGKREDTMGIRCVPVVELHFRDVKVPVENLLGGSEGGGFKNAMQTLDRARPGVAAQGLGVAQGAFELAGRYTAQRKQFGQKLNQMQGIQFMLADMATKIEAARTLVHRAALAVDDGDKDYSKLSAMSKLFATDVAMSVATDAVQLFGGYGFTRDYPIEKYMRDAKITQIYEGTNQIQRFVIARHVTRELSGGEAMLPSRETVHPAYRDWEPGSGDWVSPDFE